MDTHSIELTRRTALQILGATGVSGLAGCLGDGSSGPGTTAETRTRTSVSTSGPFKSVDLGNFSIEITLAADTAVDRINVVDPEGALYEQAEVAEGSTTVSITIGSEYTPGEHRLVAVDTTSDTTVAETSVTIEPSLSVTEVGRMVDLPETEWPKHMRRPQARTRAYFRITNDGTGPGLITGFKADTNAPRLVDCDSRCFRTITGENVVSDGVTIPLGTEVLLFTEGPALIAEDDKEALIHGGIDECTETPREKTFVLTIFRRFGEALTLTLQYTYRVQEVETAQGLRDKCTVTDLIRGGGGS